MQQEYIFKNPFLMESGHRFRDLHLCYHTYGTLNATGDNVIWVFHALTANAEPEIWWEGLFGNGNILDPERYFIVCVNMPGSYYGSSCPHDVDHYGQKYLDRFPLFTIRDMVHAYQQVRDALHITRIQLAIGGSMGGMQALEWAIEEPHAIKDLILLACNHQQSPWGIAFNTAQRMAIEADNTFYSGDGNKGLEAARAIAMLSYRNYRTFCSTQQDDDAATTYRADAYQRYQGTKLSKRFDAQCYYTLTKSMDSHCVGRGRTDVSTALQSIRAKTLVIGIDSDILFPVVEQAFLARQIPSAGLDIISSTYGHDGFLIEHGKIRRAILQYFPHYQKEKALCAIHH